MFKKIKDLSVKAVIWYQGESDVYHSDIYDKLFSALILNWRDSLGDIPFMFVQLAPFSYWLASRGNGFPALRQKQELVSRNLPGAYMVSIMDVGDEDDIHPKDKKTVGERLALMARGKIYGEDIVCEPMGPIACSLFANSLKIDFDNAKEISVRGEKINGLEIKNGESNVEVIGFKTEGSSLILTLDGEYDSLDVSLMDCPFVEGNLYSDSGLCAKPFSIKTNP
jgi:sialate O-acetylesterase